MRYITRTTLLTRLRSNACATIFIPPGEVFDAETDPENPVIFRLLWRGQNLRVTEPEFSHFAESAEPLLKS